MATPVSLLSRFRATLVGAVVGDCIGANFEDRWLPYVSWDDLFKAVRQLQPGSERYTDDTAMSASVACSLAENNRLVPEDLAKRFAEQYFAQPGRGYGAGVVRVFARLRDSGYTDVYRPASEQFDGSGSYGNGGAMRISPVALFAMRYNSFTDLRDLSEKVTRLTHTHKDGIIGALLQVSAVDLALRGPGAAEDLDCLNFIDRLIDRIKPEEMSGSDEILNKLPYTEKLLKMKNLLEADKVDPREIAEALGNDVSALRSVPTAIYSFLRSRGDVPGLKTDSPFQKAVLYAISMGGDTDTIATMAGAIAGAFYGMEAIPEKWQTACEGVTEAKEQADQLYQLYKCSQ